MTGQLRLRAASVLIVGAGGLGCPAAIYIAGAGVKTLGLVDGDTVELSNLHRQILHNTNTINMWKVDSAIQYLKTSAIFPQSYMILQANQAQASTPTSTTTPTASTSPPKTPST